MSLKQQTLLQHLLSIISLKTLLKFHTYLIGFFEFFILLVDVSQILHPYTLQLNLLYGYDSSTKSFINIFSRTFLVFDHKGEFLQIIHPLEVFLIWFLIPIQKTKGMVICINHKFFVRNREY